MPTKRKPVRWPGRPWSTLAKMPKASATLRVRLPWQADPFATPMPRPGDLGITWDRMWDAAEHTFLMATRRPDRLCRFVLSRAYRRSFGWTDMQRTPLAPGDANLLRVGKKVAGRVLDGRTWDEMPEPLGATP